MSVPVGQFCRQFGLEVPILLAPMAGACPPELSIAVAKGGGAGACSVLLMSADEIRNWVDSFRRVSAGPFQLNDWIPDAPPERCPQNEALLAEFLRGWGPEPGTYVGPPDFESQCEAMLKARPTIVSSIMGVYSPEFVRQLKQEGIAYFATVTTVEEAKIAEASGADAVVAQGMEAGGHRGAFNAADAEQRLVGLFSLLPAVVDAVEVPVVAAGGIADGRGIAAAIILGASAVQIGTGFLRCPEAGISIAWADELAHTLPEETRISRVFSGRPARGIETAYVRAATEPEAPKPAPYPVQRALTAPMRSAAARENDIDRMQAWAGQSAALARALPASELIKVLWEEARSALRQNI